MIPCNSNHHRFLNSSEEPLQEPLQELLLLQNYDMYPEPSQDSLQEKSPISMSVSSPAFFWRHPFGIPTSDPSYKPMQGPSPEFLSIPAFDMLIEPSPEPPVLAELSQEQSQEP